MQGTNAPAWLVAITIGCLMFCLAQESPLWFKSLEVDSTTGEFTKALCEQAVGRSLG